MLAVSNAGATLAGLRKDAVVQELYGSDGDRPREGHRIAIRS